jgi:hypothetical protein
VRPEGLGKLKKNSFTSSDFEPATSTTTLLRLEELGLQKVTITSSGIEPAASQQYRWQSTSGGCTHSMGRFNLDKRGGLLLGGTLGHALDGVCSDGDRCSGRCCGDGELWLHQDTGGWCCQVLRWLCWFEQLNVLCSGLLSRRDL